MIKFLTIMSMFVFNLKSHAVVPFEELKGLHDAVKIPLFSNVHGFLALNTGTLERIRFYGPYELGAQHASHPQWLHPAFSIKQDDPHAFSKKFEYPSDPICALMQWLFPSVDGALFVANNRDNDIVGNMGRNLKKVSDLPQMRAKLDQLRSNLNRIPHQERTIEDINLEIDQLKNHRQSIRGKLTQEQINERKETTVRIRTLGNQKDEIQKRKNLINQITEKEKQIQELEFMPKILKCIREGLFSHPSQTAFQRFLGVEDESHASPSLSTQLEQQKTIFTQILYESLKMDGTFDDAYNVLYPKNIALHALLGYIWSVCNSKKEVISIMKEAGLLVHDHSLASALLEETRYTKADYETIKHKENTTFEELAFAGYGYEVYERPNPEMIVYSSADINASYETLEQYPYLKTHRPYPDCGETSLRNLFNLIAYKGSGEFDNNLLPDLTTPYMQEIKQFYRVFSTISSQKKSGPYKNSANTAWSTIVSNLNGTENSLNSPNPMDVRYDGYSNIKASLGMKNILNVMAKFTGDPILNEIWRTEDEKTHIAQKLTRLCEIFSRRDDFKMTWEVDGQASAHGNFKLTVTRGRTSYDFIFSITPNHFAITTSTLSPNDWRKLKLNRIDYDLLKPFYDKNSSPFLNPLIMEQQEGILKFWQEQNMAAIPLTLRILYKSFGSVVEDENAQISIMRGLGNLDRTSPLIIDWLTTLLINQLNEKNPDRAAMFRYEFLSDENMPSNIDLNISAQFGFTKTVQYLIDQGAIIDTKNEALITASSNGHTQIVKMLLKAGAQKEATSEYKQTALIIASYSGFIDIVEILLNAKANKDAIDLSQETPLMVASDSGHTQIVEMLLKAGAQKEATNKYKETALIHASRRGHIEVVKVLLNANAEVNKTDNKKMTALMHASRNGRTDVVEILLNADAEVNKTDNKKMTALIHASRNAHIDAVKILLENKANIDQADGKEMTALMHASDHGHIDVMEILLNANLEVNKTDNEGMTALIHASRNGHIDAVKILLRNGAKLNETDNQGMTALMHASRNGRTDVVEILLENKANIDQADGKEMTALMYASYHDHIDAVKILLRNGAKVDQTDTYKMTALMYASHHGHIDAVKILLRNDAKLNETDNEGMTALMHASRNGRTDVVEILLRNGAEVNQTDIYKMTALMYASYHDHIDAVKILLRNGAKVDQTDTYEMTALMYASHHGRTEVMEILLNTNAEVK